MACWLVLRRPLGVERQACDCIVNAIDFQIGDDLSTPSILGSLPYPPSNPSGMSFFSRNTCGPASSQVTQRLQFQVPTYLQSPPWSAHAPPFGQAPSPFLRDGHTLSASVTAASELFLFGGYVHSSETPSNDLYAVSTQDVSATFLKTSGDVPSPRFAHDAALTNTTLFIWGGWTDFNDQDAQRPGHDDSLYVLNIGTSDLFHAKTRFS